MAADKSNAKERKECCNAQKQAILAVTKAFLIASKHVVLNFDDQHHTSRDADGYPLAGVDEVPTAEQSLVSE